MLSQHDEKYIDLEKLALGNQDAFRLLFMKYYPKVKYFITYFVKTEAVAEELSQDIFEYIWLNKEYLADIKSLNAYLFHIAKNKSINYLNHQKIEEDYASSYMDLSEYSIEEELYAKELKLLIQLTVEKMPEQRRRIFEMSRMKNLKNSEIAEKLNISKKTVENHLNLALKQIREVTALSILFFL
jgi:RNA polymerase sigma-70 factor (ECF subfamily)